MGPDRVFLEVTCEKCSVTTTVEEAGWDCLHPDLVNLNSNGAKVFQETYRNLSVSIDTLVAQARSKLSNFPVEVGDVK